MSEKSSSWLGSSGAGWVYFAFILLTSFFTYFYHYAYPPDPFWDEPYHIASAQKYLNRVYFMEQHPPLGKLLIAAGEKLLHPNVRTDQFIDSDYARGFEAVSFAGFRFFPTLLGWLTAPLLFLLFLFITRSSAMSALLSFLYVFDNALIVHSRGAMTDSTFIFFSVLTLLPFVMLSSRRTQYTHWQWIALCVGMGAAFGLTITTKVTGLLFILLFPALALRLLPDWRRIGLMLLAGGIGFLIAFVSVWHIHFALGKTVNPKLNNDGYYQASGEYRALLAAGTTASLKNFPLMLRDSMKFVGYYSKGVPRLDLCKKDENGSPSFLWPFGVHSIDYRWTQDDDTTYRYLYLQINPVIWACGLIGILLAAALLLCPLIFPWQKPVQHRFLLLTFLGLYVAYMLTMSQITRVMYLYHYFPPLIFSFVLFALVVENIDRIGKRELNEHMKVVGLTVLGLLIFSGYQFFRPLTYYEPISNRALERRAKIFPLWELHCGKCPRTSTLLVPVTD